MKNSSFFAYFFEATHHPTKSNVYSIKLIDSYIGKIKQMPLQILRYIGWNELELNLNGPAISIYPISTGEKHLPEIIFYKQTGNVLMGKDLQTDRLVYGTLFGPRDQNGITTPTHICLQIAPLYINNFYKFHTLSCNDLQVAA